MYKHGYDFLAGFDLTYDAALQIRGIIFVNIVPVLSRVPTTWQFTE